jgi:lysophospholipase L1-like esterase
LTNPRPLEAPAAAGSARGAGRLRHPLAIVLLQLVAFAVLCAAGEIAVRIWWPEYTMLHQAAGTTGGQAIRLNTRGFRDVEHQVARPPGVRRVVVIGDSIAWGYSVAMESGVSRVLEGLLNARGSRRFEVINLAGVGRDPGMYVDRLDEITAYGPDAVLYLMCLNDVGDAYVRTHGRYRGPIAAKEAARAGGREASGLMRLRDALGDWRWRARRSALFSLVDTEFTLWLYRHRYLDMSPARAGMIELVAAFGDVSWSEEAWGQFLGDVEGLRTAFAERDVALVVGQFPYRFLLDGPRENPWGVDFRRRPIDPFRRVREYAATRGVPYVDVREAYDRALAERRRAGLPYRALFGPLDFVHPNAHGHAVAARAIADGLAGL